ncbi:protein translocase subunit SecF, partial [Paenibacillus sp. EKM208P]
MSKWFYTFSIIITLLGILSLSIFGLNYGVDFRSGSNVDVNLTKVVTQEQIQTLLNKQGIGKEVDYTPGKERFGIRFS